VQPSTPSLAVTGNPLAHHACSWRLARNVQEALAMMDIDISEIPEALPNYKDIPFYRRHGWIIAMILLFWIPTPFILLTGNVYRRTRDGFGVPLGSYQRRAWAGGILLLQLGLVMRAVLT
jgi:hypothetical protein